MRAASLQLSSLSPADDQELVRQSELQRELEILGKDGVCFVSALGSHLHMVLKDFQISLLLLGRYFIRSLSFCPKKVRKGTSHLCHTQTCFLTIPGQLRRKLIQDWGNEKRQNKKEKIGIFLFAYLFFFIVDHSFSVKLIFSGSCFCPSLGEN